MNPIETIERDIQRDFPTAQTKLRRPGNPAGEWWLDVKNDSQDVVIQWTPRRGFGISASELDDVYGEGPEETFESREAATSRVMALLRSKGHTKPPQEVVLKELRSLIGFTQEQLATELGVQQAAVSRLERRDDFTLSSLRRFVAALGAELEINIRTPKGDVVRLADTGVPKPQQAACDHFEHQLTSVTPCEEITRIWSQSWHRDILQVVGERACPSPSPDLKIDDDNTVALALSDPSTGHIRINSEAVVGFARWFGTQNRVATRSLGAEAVTRQVYRHVLAHEIGHCLVDFADAHFVDEELRAESVAGWLAAKTGDDALLGATLSNALGCRIHGCTYPAPEERASAYLIGFLRGERESSASVNLVVVRTGQLERSREFYSCLGLSLRKERHGTGPTHYSCEAGGTVVELYPEASPGCRLRLGLRLPGTAGAIEQLLAAGWVAERPAVNKRADGSRVWVLRDPDGNAVELESTTTRSTSGF